MIDIPFDQYQRYKTTEIMVNSLKEYHKLNKIKIIEVGANEHKNLERFLLNDDIYYLDINIPKHLENDPKYILGDATNLVDIKDSEYDMVVALDVYEHIPEIQREKFLTELDRISKYGVMICAPFGYQYVEDAEVRANEYHKAIIGDDYPWLKEHIDEKLPCLKLTNKIIADLNKSFFNFQHGDIYLWEKLTKCHFYSSKYLELIKYRYLIDEFYNRNIFMCDTSKKNYRTFIFYSDNLLCTKFIDKKIKEYFSNESSFEDLNLLDNLIKDILHINYTNEFNKINLNDNKSENCYELNFYIKENKDNNYSEEKCIKKNINSNKVFEKVELDMYDLGDEIRIDPINSNCIIEILEIYTIKENEKINLDISWTNCEIEYFNKYFFSENDPQIYIDLQGIDIKNLYINYRLIDYNNESIKDIISILLDFKNINKELIENITKTSNQKEIDKIELEKELKNKIIDKDKKIKELEKIINNLEMYKQEIETNKSWIFINKIKQIFK